MKMKHKLFSLVSILTILFGAFLISSEGAKANQVTNFTNKATISKSDGTPLTPNAKVSYWEPLAISNSISIPDDVDIHSGDTMTIKLPEQLKFTTKLAFDVYHANGQLAGKAVTDPNTQSVTVTFTDIFEKLPLNKVLSLNFNVQMNHTNSDQTGPITFNYNGVVYTVIVGEKEVGPVSPVIYKTGYQDQGDPSIIHWKVLINGKQEAIDNLTLTDTVGEGQEIVTSSMVAARLKHVEGDDVDSLDEAASRPYEEDFSKTLSYKTNNAGAAVGFTHTFANANKNAIFISYDTKLTQSQSVGNDMTNSISISGNNVTSSSQVGYARIESAYGQANSRRRSSTPSTTVVETTTTNNTTTSTSATTETTSATTSNNSSTTETTTKTNSTTTEAKTTTESGTTTTGAKTTSSQSTSLQTNVPSTTNVTTSSNQASKRPVTFALPRTGEQAGLWLSALGLVIVTVTGIYFYRARR
ncbi:collagen binding domain-containing protein [Streptococcus macacae]|uniref:Gram positive anchor n=1 Tax=Streptococcus macacae NCTC 11558 TaxID=764298 RepID=G5JU74_9STRE|nr:collagen binding domain-containing protein [Streptococcus macacae]EHJ51974.1 gram positive anchor [Streptococcus macacae NCTC 11558]SUN78439.1 cell wall-associated protein [Streptococcus macacae NCTC 11558]